MEMNWRDTLSIISSPEPDLGLRLSQFSIFFLQQVGGSACLPSDAEEVKEKKAVPMAITKAMMNSRLIFFMVVVLEFDETIGENVTTNLKIVGWRCKRKLTKRLIGAMDCHKKGVNCSGN